MSLEELLTQYDTKIRRGRKDLYFDGMRQKWCIEHRHPGDPFSDKKDIDTFTTLESALEAFLEV